MTLDEAEIVKVTGGKKRHKAQARVLVELGIPFRPRGDGSLAVSRTAAEKALGGVLSLPAKTFEPDWETVA